MIVGAGFIPARKINNEKTENSVWKCQLPLGKPTNKFVKKTPERRKQKREKTWSWEIFVWKTLPSKARETRDEVSGRSDDESKTLPERQYHKYCPLCFICARLRLAREEGLGPISIKHGPLTILIYDTDWYFHLFPSERRYRVKREKPVTKSREEMTTKKNFAWKAIP